jgi:UbiD family decarboxylase
MTKLSNNAPDLRGFISELEAIGQLRQIDAADWNIEIGAITETVSDKEGPALLFDNIKGYPTGFRILSNAFRTHDRFGVALGLGSGLHGLNLLQQWRKKFKAMVPVSPVEVDDGLVLQNRLEGDKVDVLTFPAPRWHEKDGGRYLGTGCCVITVDPETGRSNLGTYRCMVQGRDRVSIKMNKGKHGRMAMEKYHAKGLPCPVAISVGEDPMLFLASVMSLPVGVEEYRIAGGLRDAPIEVVRSPLHGLPIPARGEIVLEGEIPIFGKESLPQEGPFGEWAGYYADTTTGEVPLMVVKAIYYRDNPIILGMPPMKPPNHYMSLPLGVAALWDQLEAAGVPGITGVWSFIYGGVVGPFVAISIKQAYLGHAKQTLMAATGTRAGAYGGKFVVVVDDDVDVTNLHDVIWAMSTRCDPGEAIDHVRGIWTSPADPAIPPHRRNMTAGQTTMRHGYTMDRVLIDACRPYAWLDEFPEVNAFPKEEKDRMTLKWKL